MEEKKKVGKKKNLIPLENSNKWGAKSVEYKRPEQKSEKDGI